MENGLKVILVVAGLLTSPVASSFGDAITTVPSVVDQETDFVLHFSGVASDSCSIPNDLQVAHLSAQRIEIEFRIRADAACFAAHLPYELVFDPTPDQEVAFASNVEVTLREVSSRDNDPDSAGQLIAETAIQVREQIEPEDALPLPESGLWWDSFTPGVGYGIDLQSGFLFFTSYLHDEQGQPVWTISQGNLERQRFRALRLRPLGGGAPIAEVGRVDLVFDGSNQAWLSVDGNAYSKISRFRTVTPGSLVLLNTVAKHAPIPNLSGEWIELSSSEGELNARRLRFELLDQNSIQARFIDTQQAVSIECAAEPLLPEFTPQRIVCSYLRESTPSTILRLDLQNASVDGLLFKSVGENITLYRPVPR